MVAARRKKPVAPAAVDVGAFTVVVETLRGDFKVFGEALADVKAEVHDVRVEVHNLKAETQAGFERLDREVRTGFARVDRELGLVKSAVLEHGRELREIRDRKVDRDQVEGIVQGALARAGGG
jgi:hypothetical protein